MNTTTLNFTADHPRATLWARTSAKIYDRILWLGERRALRARRQDLVAGARGTTLEIGSGTGLNLAHYPADLDRLVLAEPDMSMRARLERRVSELRPRASVIDAPAERLPFGDGTLDTVVSTLVLCTVDSPEAALREIARVLAADGQLLFLEHVRASSDARAFLQDRLAAPWRAFGSGCRCNQQTVAIMAACGFQIDLSESSWRGMPSIVKPLVHGRATPQTGRIRAGDGGRAGDG